MLSSRHSSFGLAALASFFAGLNQSLHNASQATLDFGRSAKKPRPSKSGEPAFRPYVDRAGQSHGRSGDKLARKANAGVIGIIGGRRGHLDGLSHSLRFPFSAKRVKPSPKPQVSASMSGR